MSAGAVIQPEKILRELDELWVSLGRQEEQERSDGVLRACAMTLIVATAEVGDEAEVGETLAMLIRGHPSRAIVLRVSDAEPARLDARVFAQCWMPFGKRQQICCEQIEIVAGLTRLPDLAPVVRSLLVPDLPIAMWCRSRQLLSLAELEPVLGLATKLIVDSAGIEDLEEQIEMIRGKQTPERRVGDLAWTRLTRWRESIAQMFDNRDFLARLPKIGEVLIDYEGGHVPMSAYYLAAWLRNALGRNPSFRFRRLGACKRARVQAVALRGEDVGVSITAGQDRGVKLRGGVRDARMVFPSLSDYELLGEELSLLGHDPVYDEVVQRVPEFTGTVA